MEQLIRQAFTEFGHNKKELLATIETLAGSRGEEVYQAVFRYLLRKNLDSPRAGRYWREALARWDSMAKVKGGNLRIRAALLDYLHNVVGEKLVSVNDGLTGLYNWAYGKHYAEKLLAYMRRSKSASSLALVLLDLDHFRRYNELCGPMEGDRGLRKLAEIIRRHIREMDVSARYDNGDFALVLPNSDRTQAFAVAERIRATVEKTAFPGQEGLPGGNLTISCGIAAFPQDGDSIHTLLQEAGRGLADAKRTCNRTCPQKPERRREQRRKVCSVVEVATNNATPFFTAMAFDISRNGIAIGCDADLTPGTPLRLRFRRPFWPRERNVTGTVRQARRDTASGVLHAGLEFAAPQNGLCKPVSVSA